MRATQSLISNIQKGLGRLYCNGEGRRCYSYVPWDNLKSSSSHWAVSEMWFARSELTRILQQQIERSYDAKLNLSEELQQNIKVNTIALFFRFLVNRKKKSRGLFKTSTQLRRRDLTPRHLVWRRKPLEQKSLIVIEYLCKQIQKTTEFSIAPRHWTMSDVIKMSTFSSRWRLGS